MHIQTQCKTVLRYYLITNYRLSYFKKINKLIIHDRLRLDDFVKLFTLLEDNSFSQKYFSNYNIHLRDLS